MALHNVAIVSEMGPRMLGTRILTNMTVKCFLQLEAGTNENTLAYLY